MGGRRLPDRAQAWAAAHAPHSIVEVTAIGGGITNIKWVLYLAMGDDPLVIRWADPLVWGAVGREHVRREALACRLLAGSALPVPQLVASDLDGAAAGGPANLMTWRPGRVRLQGLGSAAVRALARLAVAVHRQPVSLQRRPPTFSFRGPPIRRFRGGPGGPTCGGGRSTSGPPVRRSAADAVRPVAP